MNLPKFSHSAMFVGVTACGKTEFLLRLLETIFKNHFEFIVILCPTILDNKTYLTRKWILDDKNVFIVCHFEMLSAYWLLLAINTRIYSFYCARAADLLIAMPQQWLSTQNAILTRSVW